MICLFISVGKSSNMAIVLAQLVLDDVKCGLHPFLVPLRSQEDHMPLPGMDSLLKILFMTSNTLQMGL